MLGDGSVKELMPTFVNSFANDRISLILYLIDIFFISALPVQM